MSIAVWKTILGLAKLGAVLILAAAGFFFWSHTRAMAKGFEAPNFAPEAKLAPEVVAKTTNLSLQLGRFQRERPAAEVAPKVDEAPPFETQLAKLGEITDVIGVYEPYPDDSSLRPAINFKYRQRPAGETSDTRTVRLGEALVERPNPEAKGHFPIPVGFRFVRCEHDPKNPGFTLLWFDVKCDGTDVQSARWKFEEPEKAVPSAEGAPTEPLNVQTDKAWVGPPPPLKKPEDAAKPADPAEVKVVPVAPEPAPPPVEAVQEPAGTLFGVEEDVFVPTAEGIDYLERNYEDILKQTRTETYRDREGRTGIRVVGLSNQALANQFGIMKDDVILRINGIPVSSQSEAVSVVKQELKKKGSSPILRVTIRRRGAEKELRFDTRDPATRRAAKRAFK